MHLSRLGARSSSGRAPSSPSASCRGLLLGIEHHAAEEEPGRSGALASQGTADRLGFLTLAGVMHGLPLAYSKDLQEDKEALFDTLDGVELCLEAAEGMLGGLSLIVSGSPRRPPTSSRRRPTSPTSWSARGCRSGRPTAWSVGWCARHSSVGKVLSELTPEELLRRSDLLDDSSYEACVRGDGWSRRARLAAPRRAGSPSSSRRPGPPSRRSGGEHATAWLRGASRSGSLIARCMTWLAT